MEFRLLGPLEVVDAGRDVAITAGKRRALLTLLLLHRNAVVPADRLIEELWSGRPPPTAAKSLQVHVSQLRKELVAAAGTDEAALLTRAGGYVLEVPHDSVDIARFEDAVAAGEHALADGRPADAAARLRDALDLWRGPIGDDLPDTPALRAWAAELTERKLTAEDDLAEARLQLADHAGLVATLRRRLAANPHRERTAELLIRALHTTGDRNAALGAYQSFRAQLVDDLGIEPSSQLQTIHVELLRDDGATDGERARGGARSGQAMTRIRHKPGNRRRALSHEPSAR
jgi:DNA-binding SARP family transcriptional activator